MAEFVDEDTTTIIVTDPDGPGPEPTPCSGTLSFFGSYVIEEGTLVYRVSLTDFEGDTTISLTDYGFIIGPDGAPGTIDPDDPLFSAPFTQPSFALPGVVAEMGDGTPETVTWVFKFTIAGEVCGTYGPFFVWLDPQADGDSWTVDAYISADPAALVWQSIP